MNTSHLFFALWVALIAPFAFGQTTVAPEEPSSTTDVPIDTTEDTTVEPAGTTAAPGAPSTGAACAVCEASCASCGGSKTASCKTVCDIIKDPTTCDQRCTDTLHLGEWVGSANAQASNSACECLSLCHQCEVNGSNTADCQTVCGISSDPATCEQNCASTLHLGEWAPQNTVGSTATCVCTSLCTQCGGSNTADCQTVCEIASDAATCSAKCAETLHLGDYYQGSASEPTSSGYSKEITTAVSASLAATVVMSALVQV